MRPRVVVAVGLAMLAACEPARDPLPAPAAEAVTATAGQPVAQTRYFIAQPLNELTDSADRADRYREQAIGVVVPVYEEAAPQELSVVNDTVYEIQTIARVRFYPRADGGWTDTLWTKEANLYGGLIRATHDDYGLPVVAVRGRWLRVHYAFAEDGSPRDGWVRLVPGKSAYHDRDKQMFEFSTSLVDAGSTEFFRAPRGQLVRVDPGHDHTVQVLSIEGDWIRIVVMQPDTSACTGDEDQKVRQRDTVWVQKYNTQGKRQLTSAIAGC